MLGIRRGFRDRARAAALRQGSPPDHRRDHRCARCRRHDLYSAGQPRCHGRATPYRRTSCDLRPTRPRTGRRHPLVTRAWLREPHDSHRPRQRPRRGSRIHQGRRLRRRVLAWADGDGVARPSARRCYRRRRRRAALPMEPRTSLSHRSRHHPQPLGRCRRRLGRHTRWHRPHGRSNQGRCLGRRAFRSLGTRGSCCTQVIRPGRRRGTRSQDLHRRPRHDLSPRHRRRCQCHLGVHRGPSRRHHRDCPPTCRRQPRWPPRAATRTHPRRDRQPVRRALAALTHGRRRRLRYLYPRRHPVPRPGPRQMGRAGRGRNVGRRDSPPDPRWLSPTPRPSRPRRRLRRPRRRDPQLEPRPRRQPHHLHQHSPHPDPSTRRHPHPPTRHRRPPRPHSPTDPPEHDSMAGPAGRRPNPRQHRPGSVRGEPTE